jgi:hypothetical protein
VVQSRDWTHCWWQLANLHESGLLQSLFWMHVPPRSSFLELALHEAAAMATRKILMSKLDRFIFVLPWTGWWQSVPQNGIVGASMLFGGRSYQFAVHVPDLGRPFSVHMTVPEIELVPLRVPV